MLLESTDGKWKTHSVDAKCDECGCEYRAMIKTAERQFKELGVHHCRICSSRRAGKKTAAKMSAIYSVMYSGENNFSKKPGVAEKISKALKGKKFTEEHKANLRKKRPNCENIKEASNRPEERERRRNRMLTNNPSKRKEVREKISKTVSALYAAGVYNLHKVHDTGWISTSKTICPIWCRSGLEKTFLNHIESIDEIVFVESAEYLALPYEYNGIVKTYLPDFKLTLKCGSVIVVETKSSYYQTLNIEQNKLKMDALIVYCKENNVECVTLNEKEIISWLELLQKET